MIDSLIVFEKCLIGFIAVYICLTQPRDRMWVSFFFSTTILAHQCFFQSFSNNIEAYYISAGLLDLSVLCAIALMTAHPRLATDIQHISMASIMLNGFGYFSPEPEAYMMTYVFLYGWSIYILLRGEPLGDTKTDTRFLSIYPNVSLRFTHNHLKEKKECPTAK